MNMSIIERRARILKNASNLWSECMSQNVSFCYERVTWGRPWTHVRMCSVRVKCRAKLAIRFITPTLYLWNVLLSPNLSLLFLYLKHLHLFLFFHNQWPSPFLLLFPLSWQFAFAEFSIFGSAFTQIFLHLPSSPPRFISLPSSLSLSLACYSSPSFSTFSLHPLPPKFPLSISFSLSRCSTH